jgi:hypothetical protein
MFEEILKHYHVSKLGEVFSKRTGNQLRPYFSGGNNVYQYKPKYLKFDACINGKRHRVYVHHLQAYIKFGMWTQNEEVHHINHMTGDNRRRNIAVINKRLNRQLQGR